MKLLAVNKENLHSDLANERVLINLDKHQKQRCLMAWDGMGKPKEILFWRTIKFSELTSKAKYNSH